MRKIILIWLIVLWGCGSRPEPPLRLAVNPWIGYDPLVLAAARGTLPPRLRIVELPSNSESQRALANGLTEAAAMTLDEALRLSDTGVPLRLVAVLDVSHGADALLAHPEITSPRQLKGRRIGVETTAVGSLMLAHFLDHYGIAAHEIDIVHVESAQHVDALRSRRVDAVITFEPMRSLLTRQGFRVLFDSREMPDMIYDVIVIRSGTADPSLILAAWRQSLELLGRDWSAATELLSRGTGLSPPEYRRALEGLRFLSIEESKRLLTLPQNGDPLIAVHSRPLVDMLIARDLLAHPPNWRALLGENGDKP